LQALCSQEPDIRYLGQKALVCYVRSVHLNSNKEVFKVNDLNIDEFAASLGLPGTPKLRFIAKSNSKNANRQLAALESSHDDDDDSQSMESRGARVPVSKMDKMFRRKNLDVYSEHFKKLRDSPRVAVADEEEDAFLTVKRRDHEITPDELSVKKGPMKMSCRDLLKTKKKFTLKNAQKGEHVTFDDEGKSHKVFAYTPEASFDRSKAANLAEQFVADGRSNMAALDREDAEMAKAKRRTDRTEKKRKLKEAERNKQIAKMPRIATLGVEDSE
jgi:ATP-dependent RNA helicase DDX10/DBP4